MIEHLDAFFTAFAVDCLSGAYAFRGHLDRDYANTLGIANAAPILHAQSVDVTAGAIVTGGAITVDSVAYTVREIRPDGTGITILVLERA